MALAEARAAWQRTANRCLVQEDAKRAPKLACCSSVSPSAKHAETEPANAAGGQDVPSSNSSPFHRTPSYSNLSPNTKWWLQTRPNYGCQRGLNDDCRIHESSGDMARSEEEYELVDQCKNLVTCEKKGIEVEEEKLRPIYHQNWQDPMRVEFEEDLEELRDMFIVSSEGSKSSGDLYFESESSWVRTEKNIPWWRTADTEELAFLVAQKSVDLIENCDLPSPQNVNAKKTPSSTLTCPSHSEISSSLPLRKSGIAGYHSYGTHGSSTATSAGSYCRMMSDEQLLSSAKIPQRDSPTTHERNTVDEDDVAKARLLEALRHSQTRAREAETVARQACAEKEHVVKLVFRQAQQLFAYKQWLQLLQLENMYYQLKNNKILSAATESPAVSPWSWAGARSRKMQKGWMKSSCRNRGKRSRPRPRPRPRFDVGKYAIVFALGLGLVGAGLLLGWTIGWMLPTW
ncbi:uncharacterized protein LOC131020819 [Salvia miltiorrhiza]|uniref:uncharacterized protein LOC131020819 n=1 Tax=Salvia miltiorrhiza TaxID=226208 RepID=UPI0025AD0756|nr:uncharacterized protein LOC131020819 [Salvia miltiorrhiza]XP_057805833.1 uncharacterized protein LOC131020819 [Salvia miltiorrhiza]XP_057805834.1 uncharacterized protein LOC131020819 [Salvia miltiorrhiza]XP_057805835.1 uncharacterized protein LOC131020819 [Salvia miltiorrhiza]XP_057805836.1 uncharacterized protein LOC131020819 [Salvia miltiorrhiza]XP_057805837.1 uncharacterized protein LOC131020819 [Salvia miltiorrhiza]XP_057805838.1 uncharacterized protein LOC131020819 [Salvia miltiorrhiz